MAPPVVYDTDAEHVERCERPIAACRICAEWYNLIEYRKDPR